MTHFGDMLMLARHYRRVTQRDSAAKLGIPQAVLSRYENGITEPTEDILLKAAQYYQLPKEFFEIRDTIYGAPVSVHTMFRGKKTELTSKEIDRVTAELNIRLFFLKKLLENVDLCPVFNIPHLDLEDYDSIEQIASIVRAHWMLPNGPIRNLTKILEHAGIIIGESDFNGASISGVTFAVPGRAPIILINNTHSADRLRFTLAHELGHLVMHTFPSATMELEANNFASSFLLPSRELKLAFHGQKITLELLASLKREWRVSMQSILMRAKQLGFLSVNQERYLWKQISMRGWRYREPERLDFPIDRPTVITQILKSHIDDLGYSWSELIKMSKINNDDFNNLYRDSIEDIEHDSKKSVQKVHLHIVK